MKANILLILALLSLSLTGCDFFRTLAGRPTSEDIESRRIEIMKVEEAALQARIDSLRLAKQSALDSLELIEAIKQSGGSILNPATLGGLFATKLEAKYYIIIGTFRLRSNAEALHNKAKEKGYAPALISFNSGRIAVGLCPQNNLQDVLNSLKSVKKEDFCPSDVWVLLNE